MNDQENKQAKQDLPADQSPKPAPKPSPEKQAPPLEKWTASASKKVKKPKSGCCRETDCCSKQREARKNKGF